MFSPPPAVDFSGYRNFMLTHGPDPFPPIIKGSGELLLLSDCRGAPHSPPAEKGEDPTGYRQGAFP